ncbi:MAB_1171c family putative transporter [Pseudonocardia acidicola]|uniref:DUF6545 domain-containing protein n=1 Tax=Pseudonocardia acidicola TaxID=2724939 RepID=A0ABX1SI67_9PSEU|nr:MAB_1171c family putative transporter [Pseudonocardia acidicola]NMI00635.1 hypothetical protein [Pseudonocardia acidicola]
MILQLSAASAVALWVGVVLLALAVSQAPHDVVLRYFAGLIFLLAVQHSLVVDQNGTTAFMRLLGNLLGLAAGCVKVCFFLTALRQQNAPRPRLWIEVMAASTVGAVGVVAWLLAPPEVRPAIGQPKNAHLLAAFVFQMAIIGYLASVSFRTINWSVRLIRRLQNSVFRAGLVLVGLAAVGSLVAGLLDIYTHIVAFVAPSRIDSVQFLYPSIVTTVALSFVLLLIGAMLPVLDGTVRAVPLALEQLNGYRTLGPLWRALRTAFPTVPFRAGWAIHRLFYRRGMEIRDGLVLLGPFYDRAIAALAEEQSRARGESAEDRSIMVAAALVRAALQAHRAGRPLPDPHPIPTSGADDWATDTAWLVRLGRAFASSPQRGPTAVSSSSLAR